jgi:hypothetical protein
VPRAEARREDAELRAKNAQPRPLPAWHGHARLLDSRPTRTRHQAEPAARPPPSERQPGKRGRHPRPPPLRVTQPTGARAKRPPRKTAANRNR